MSEQIKRAIKWHANAMTSGDFEKQMIDITLQALQAELDRLENKSLTLDELKERQGKFVWYKFCGVVKGVVRIRVVFDSGTVEIDDYLISANNTFVEFYDYEPHEVKETKTVSNQDTPQNSSEGTDTPF